MTNASASQTDRKQLRNFGLLIGSLIIAIFGLLIPLVRHRTVYIPPLVIGGVLMLWGLVAPASLRFVHGPWMRMALFLGRVNSFILLTLFFYLVMTPVGLLLRVFGHDPMQSGFDPKATSYRRPSPKTPRERMAAPY